MWTIPTLDMVATGKRIKELFKERNLKVEDVRQYLELESTQAVYKWLRGDSLPSIDNLYAMSILMGLTINDMLVGRESLDREEEQEPLPFFVLITKPTIAFYKELFRHNSNQKKIWQK